MRVLSVFFWIMIFLLPDLKVRAQSLIWLGTLGGREGWAYDVSDNGKVVVGAARDSSGSVRAFRWTPSGGMQDLGSLGGILSNAFGVSADGSVIVGKAEISAGSWRAFRWVESGGMTNLGTFENGSFSMARDVSSDGSAVVGRSDSSYFYMRAYRWTPLGGFESMGVFEGGNSSWAYAVSSDGSIVVGRADHGNAESAYRWTATEGLQAIGTLPGGNNSIARGISDDGSVIVGISNLDSGPSHAFRWTASGGMQDLGSLYGGESEAWDASADGSIVVGFMRNYATADEYAFRWTEEKGMEDLNVTFDSLLGQTGRMSFASAISPDGRYIVGWGWHQGYNMPFLLDTGTSTGIRNSSGRSVSLKPELLKNFPNPFNASTTIVFKISEADETKLHIFTLAGRKVRTLLNKHLSAGVYRICWDGKNGAGRSVASGIYLYRLTSGRFSASGKMLLVR